MLHFTSTYYKILNIKKKIKNIQGGQGAGKNIAICQILLKKALEKKRVITVMTDTYDNLKDGAIKDFRNVFKWAGIPFNYNKQSKDLLIQDSIIQFRYINDIKSGAGKSKRRDILYINEANKVGWEVASTYIGRTHEDVFLDYNPDLEFWAHTKVPLLKDKNNVSLSERIIVTYIDNEMLPQSEVDYILSRKNNKDWFRVYGLGITGFYSERQIYTFNFIDKIPDDAKRIPSGMDFGISPDPTILINIWKKKNNLYIDEVFCENNLMPEKIKGAERMSVVDKLKQVKQKKGRLIIGDSANRTTILDMRKHDYNIIGVKKGKVIDGINDVRGYNLFITKRSKNMKKGFESWFFKVDKNGKIIPEPDRHEPDGLVALRYVIRMKPYW